jgi:quercetin dioxygenase-like cupin family protein
VAAHPVVPTPDEALSGPFGISVQVRAEHTNGVLSVIEETLPPRAFIPPHVHQNDVWVYVLHGEIGVLVGDAIATADSGQWALKPRDVQHAMWNPSTSPARILEVLTPGGSERWFEELARIPTGDQAAFDEACGRYGIEFFPQSPWIEELRRRFGLE